MSDTVLGLITFLASVIAVLAQTVFALRRSVNKHNLEIKLKDGRYVTVSNSNISTDEAKKILEILPKQE
jgi:hypothetical protein